MGCGGAHESRSHAGPESPTWLRGARLLGTGGGLSTERQAWVPTSSRAYWMGLLRVHARPSLCPLGCPPRPVTLQLWSTVRAGGGGPELENGAALPASVITVATGGVSGTAPRPAMGTQSSVSGGPRSAPGWTQPPHPEISGMEECESRADPYLRAPRAKEIGQDI